MVARVRRHEPVPDAALSPAALWWRDWRRTLARVFRTRPLARPRPLRAARLALSYLAAPSRTVREADPRDRMRLVTAGATALALGALGALAFGVRGGKDWLPSLFTVVWLIAWALARLAILRLSAPAAFRGSPRPVEAAWGPALLPFALAIASPLDLVALAASAFYTLAGLQAVGFARRDAVRGVAWAFGGQVAVEVLAWIARNGFFLLAR